jgi:hypothetical protein
MHCHVPKTSPIAPSFSNLLLTIGRRWPVEETIAVGKGPVGWGHNQFRKFVSVERHNALSGMAMLQANLIRQRVEQAAESSDEAEPGHAGIPMKAAPAVNSSSMETRFPVEDDSPGERLIPLGDAAIPHLADEKCPQDSRHVTIPINKTNQKEVSLCRQTQTKNDTTLSYNHALIVIPEL